MGRMFGTDGVRGKANRELTPELAYKLGRAAALYFGDKEAGASTIYIGQDTRMSGPMYEAALSAGICSAGGNVVLLGVVPTPAVAYLTRKHRADAGIMISASHNPYYDNGIKFFGGNGYKLPDSVEDEIELLVDKITREDDLYRPSGKDLGTIKRKPHLVDEYIQFALSTVNMRLDNMHIVLDCANGAAFEVMPRILKKLGAKVEIIHHKPNGVNINDHCGSTHLESLRDAVLSLKADIGIAHDGDADRCLCIDENGAFIDGDHMIAACAIDMINKNTLKDNVVVTTVMANIGFHKAIKEKGGKTEITAVGDRYVLENMRKNGYNLGGEQSGHIIFSDFTTTGDGPVTALQVLSYLVNNNKKASDITNIMTSYPQLLVNVKVKTKDGWEENEAIKEAISGGEKLLGENGRLLVRASGTEPLIRVMAEGENQEELEEICNNIAKVIKQVQG